ncbi:hypothetical protein F5887DRAFT_913375 [Amanita rubescens]|nr:hypothetical protein F5887DRAFT_913375 [Amanita rubescens]
MGNVCRVIYRPDPEKIGEYYSVLLVQKKIAGEFVIDWHAKESKSRWGEQASSQQLDKDFGTHEGVDVVKIVIEKGEEYDDEDDLSDYEWDGPSGVDLDSDDSSDTERGGPVGVKDEDFERSKNDVDELQKNPPNVTGRIVADNNLPGSPVTPNR